MKISNYLKRKFSSKMEATLSPVVNKLMQACHEVARQNGCNLTCEEFANQVRDLLKEGESNE